MLLNLFMFDKPFKFFSFLFFLHLLRFHLYILIISPIFFPLSLPYIILRDNLLIQLRLEPIFLFLGDHLLHALGFLELHGTVLVDD